MRNPLVLFLLLLVAVPVLGTQTADDWFKFTSTEARFSLLVPVKPEETRETKDSPYGPYTIRMFISKMPGEVYIFGWVDYDPKFKFGVQAELEANRDNFVKGIKAELLSTTRISIDGHPGIEFTAESSQGFFISRVYVIGRRPVQMIHAIVGGRGPNANSTRYLSSFTITPDKQAGRPPGP